MDHKTAHVNKWPRFNNLIWVTVAGEVRQQVGALLVDDVWSIVANNGEDDPWTATQRVFYDELIDDNVGGHPEHLLPRQR